jgi:hypothetical protein
VLTWDIVVESKASLEGVHDAVRVLFDIQLVHGEAIPILDGAIVKRKAEHPAKLRCGDGDNDLGQYYRVEFPQPRRGLEVGLAVPLNACLPGYTYRRCGCGAVFGSQFFEGRVEGLWLVVDNLPAVNNTLAVLVVRRAVLRKV